MNYTFILSKNIYQMQLFEDLTKLENAFVTISERKYYTKFWNYMHNHKLIYNSLYKRVYMFNEDSLKGKKDNCIVLDSGVLKVYPVKYLLFLKKKYNAKLVLLLLNSMQASSGNVKDVKDEILSNIWDKVLSFDKFDSEQYSWEYIRLSYFSTPKKLQKHKTKPSDLYFIGGLKGNREKLIIDTFKKLYDSKVKVTFDSFCYNKKDLESLPYQDKIRFYTEWKTYTEVQCEVANTNCILEILQENQHTQSARYFEAIYYNKKLLTNNPDIVNLPYYNPKYMKYFEKPEDIDISWVKKKEKIDYKYKGDFSPVKIIQMLDEMFK